MSTTTLAPDAILSSSGYLGGTPSLADIDEDPDSADGVYAVALNTGTDTSLQVSFPTPPGNPTGVQTFKMAVKKRGNGVSAPTARIDLYENGVLLASGGDQAVNSTDLLSQTFDLATTPLSTPDGSKVEAKLSTVHKRFDATHSNCVDTDAINWDTVTYTVHVSYLLAP